MKPNEKAAVIPSKPVLQKVREFVFSRDFLVLALVLALLIMANTSFADTVGDSLSMENAWPWTRFFNSLAHELSGPLPMTLGIIAIAGAAFSLFAGHGGPGTQKFFVLIFAIGICLFAPNFMTYLKESANAATISDVMEMMPK